MVDEISCVPLFGKVCPHERHAINSFQIRISSQLLPRSLISGEQISERICVARTFKTNRD
jgi:hypothetical protein